MVKWLIGLFAVFAVASANNYGPQSSFQQQQPEAPVLPKGGLVYASEQFVAAAAPIQPIYQPQQPVYAPPPPPPQQQPPVYQPVYAPPPPPPQQTSPVPPPAYGPPPPPPQQQPPQTYVPQRQLVPDVPAPQYVQQTPPAPQQPTYLYGPPPQQQPPRPVEDYCQKNNLIDGYHVEGCKPFYFACTPISTTRSRCPKGLFFDVEAQLCDYKHFISACGGKRPPPPPPPQQQPPAYGQQPYAPQQQPPRQEFDCSSKTDGVYVIGCTSKYYICMLGTSTTLTCPTGTFYSASAEKCDYKAHVVECGGVPPPPPPPAQNPPTTYGQPAPPPPQQQQPSYKKPAPAQQEPANACTGLANGIYGRKCSQHFVACTGQKAVDFTCPAGQAFNLKTVKCAPKIEIQTCPEYEIPQQQPPAPQPHYEQPQTYAPAPPPPPPAQQPPQTYAPAPQQQYVQQAPPAPQQPSYAYGPAPQQQPPRPIEDFCQKNNLNDGYHGQGCKSHYFSCSASTTTRLQCPQGLFYDSETQACDHKNLIVACGGTRPPPPPPQQQQPPAYGSGYAPQPQYVQQAPPAPQQPTYSYGPAPQQQPPRPVEDFCQKNNLNDGYHGQGCQSHYFSCSAFTTTRLQCPQGLFYDAEIQACDHKNLIVACGGTRPKPPPPQRQPPAGYAPQPQYVQQAPPAPQQPTYSYGPAPQQQPPRPVEDFCQKNNLNDGYHGQGCQSHYFSCSAFTTTRLQCPQGLFYDSETQACDHKNLIVACGGTRPKPPPQQQPPSYGPAYAPPPQYIQQSPPAPSYPQPPPVQQQPPQYNPAPQGTY